MSDVPSIMAAIDFMAATRVPPLWGWHDDHRGLDRTPDYQPAMQQVRAEFEQLLRVCEWRSGLGGSALQLGLGRGGAAHMALRVAFDFVCSIDCDPAAVADLRRNWECAMPHDEVLHGATGDPGIRVEAALNAPYDLLLIDANHSYHGVRRDYEDYAPLMRRGGVIAFHDSLKRPTYEEEITVWKFMAELPVATIGTEVGISYLVKP